MRIISARMRGNLKT